MSKVLLVSDIHIHPHKKELRRIEDGLECLQWVYDSAKVAGCKTVIIAGDLFHDRFLLTTYAYSKACAIIAAAPVKTLFLLGNHDMFYEDQWTVHSLSSIKEWATVIEKPCTLDVDGYSVDFLPYTPHPSKYLPSFTNPSKILISHLSVSDALLNAKYDILSVEDDSKEKEILSPSAFVKWKKVWLGHYHYGQKVSDIVEYLGSPMQLTYGEAGQEKHIVVFDLKTLETEYIVNNISPKFHIIENTADIEKVDVASSYVQFRCPEEVTSKFEMCRQLITKGAREVKFKPLKKDLSRTTQHALTNIIELFNDKNKLISGYVDSAESYGIDKEMLKKIGLDIVSM